MPEQTSEFVEIKFPTQVDEANAMAHLIVEAGIVPGVTTTCRCVECRLVAKKMDEAGYLDNVIERWWDER